MPSLSEKDRANLTAGLDAVRKIEQFTLGIENANEFYSDELVFDATLMNFVVIGEVVEKLSQKVQNQFSEVPWSQIKSFRNVIAHAYFGVDAEEVWQIIHDDLPKFKDQIKRILEK